jgi:hypothetical protein
MVPASFSIWTEAFEGKLLSLSHYQNLLFYSTKIYVYYASEKAK